MQSERPVYDRKALPWENKQLSKTKLALLRRKAKRMGIPFDTPNYYADAMEMNKNHPEGGFINHVEVVVDEGGSQHTVVEEDLVVESPPSGAKIITMTDEKVAKAKMPDGRAAVMAVMKELRGRSKSVEYELTPDGKLLLSPVQNREDEEASEEAEEASVKNNLTGKPSQVGVLHIPLT